MKEATDPEGLTDNSGTIQQKTQREHAGWTPHRNTFKSLKAGRQKENLVFFF